MAHETHELEMTCTTTEPAAALFLFDFLRTQARGCGFVDVNQVFFTINMKVSGFDKNSPDYEELRHKLEQAWTHTEFVYKVSVRDDKGNKKLVRLKEDPPYVEGPIVGEERRRLMREELKRRRADEAGND